jgi:glucose/arabinose dehydrogenase
MTSSAPGRSCAATPTAASWRSSPGACGTRTAPRFTPDGRLFATEHGIDERGERYIIGDLQDLYEVEQGRWYGWPAPNRKRTTVHRFTTRPPVLGARSGVHRVCVTRRRHRGRAR